MGFLLGAFGKLSAGSRLRQLQARMMRIQSRARRVTRDVAKMEKMIDRQEKYELNSLKTMSNSSINMMQNSITMGAYGRISDIVGKMQNGTQLTTEEQSQYSNIMAMANQQIATQKAFAETQMAEMQQQIQDKYDSMRESMLEPLRDEEELLQSEKDSLESQIQIADADYKACKEMEKSDAKNLAPNYTGQG